jgi:hypothetical protein
MNNPIFLDTETCGLCGPIVLLQYAIGDGDIILWEPWHNTFSDNLNLLQLICHHDGGIIGFNLVFDWYQICKLYTIFDLFVKKYPDKAEDYPIDHINKLGILEKEARDGPCLKPVKCHDVMVHARKGPYQSTMSRKSIIIKKVPNALAIALAFKLETLIPLNDIYFAKRKDKHAPKWSIEEVKDYPDFKNLILRFKPSSALKALAADALGIKDATLFSEISLSKKTFPEELEYAPFALAIAPNYRKTKDWNGAWPERIKYHIEHWRFSKYARQYASDDVVYTRALYKHFGSPPFGDDDSELTCLIGASRWRGCAIDLKRIKDLRNKALIKSKVAPKDARKVRKYISEVLSPTEQLILKDSTKKIILEEIASWSLDEPENQAAKRAQEVLDARKATKEIENDDKLIEAERFHVSSSVIGALSGRSSGSGGGINSQGIKHTKEVRSCFPLAFTSDVLCGGDFVSFEVVLADADYGDPKLRRQLQSGKSIHGIFGSLIYPGMTYEDIMKTRATNDDKYTRSKSGLFAMIYGGTPYTLKTRLGITEEAAQAGYERFTNEYQQIGIKRKEISNRFCSMVQRGGIGSRVEWREPDDYVESMFGFKRYFTLENKICKALFDLAENPPKEWLKLKINVIRRDREQTVTGAVRSALFASAFAIQAANTRAAINHRIQSSGATLTKTLQRRIWDLQPTGINEWQVQPFNVHDEIMCPAKPKMINKIHNIVDTFIEEHRGRVPLLEIDWHDKMESWADK